MTPLAERLAALNALESAMVTVVTDTTEKEEAR